MSFLNDQSLTSLGWHPYFEFYYDEIKNPKLKPFRILKEEKSYWVVMGPEGQVTKAVASGKMRLSIQKGHDKPAVGDWILCEPAAGDHNAVLAFELLPRRTILTRKDPGENRSQTVMANVDTFFITTSANEDFNLRRLERYMSAVLESGAQAVLLVTKIDLMQNNELNQLQKQFPQFDTFGVSIHQRETLKQLQPFLKAGLTAALIGSSGVGKSSLVNAIFEDSIQKTRDIRHSDGKGRHTTTHREFFETPWGGWIADTPGMREFALFDQFKGLNEQFEDITSLEANCRFQDCFHQTEPDCAILEALQKGTLELSRWKSYLKLKGEIEFQLRKGDKALQSEAKKKWKKTHQALRAHYEFRLKK